MKNNLARHWLNPVFVILLAIPCWIGNLLGQPSISFEKEKHDFGDIGNQNFPPAVFEFTNTGDKPLAILMTNAANSVKVKYKHEFIQPGQKGKILVRHNNNKMGPFHEEIEVVTNAGNEPYLLEISGNNVDILECFPDKQNMNKRKVVVIDREDKEPISKAEVEFTHNMVNKKKNTTDTKGSIIEDLKIGMYYIDAVAENYHFYSDTLFISKSMPVIFVEMEPKAEVETSVETDPEPPGLVEETELPTDEFAANNIVFIVDVSLSMRTNNKLDLLKTSVKNLAANLRQIDQVSVISYNTFAYLLLSGVNGMEKDTIISVIDGLKPSGITDGVKGLYKGYSIAKDHFVDKGNNQIILVTDGKFTGAKDSEGEIKEMVYNHAADGIILSILGLGIDEDAITLMNDMVTLGKGSYIHVTPGEDVSGILLEEIKNKSRIR